MDISDPTPEQILRAEALGRKLSKLNRDMPDSTEWTRADGTSPAKEDKSNLPRKECSRCGKKRLLYAFGTYEANYEDTCMYCRRTPK